MGVADIAEKFGISMEAVTAAAQGQGDISAARVIMYATGAW